MIEPSTVETKSEAGRPRGLSWRLFAFPHLAHFVGGLTTILYFHLLDPVLFTRHGGEGAIDLTMLAFIVGVAGTLHAASGVIHALRLRAASRLVRDSGTGLPPDAAEPVLQTLFAVPRWILWDTVVLWGGIGLAVALYLVVQLDRPPGEAMRVFFGTSFVGGSMAIFTGFFSADQAVRREVVRLVPSLHELAGRVRFQLRNVFLATLVVAWLIPMAIVVWLSYTYVSNLAHAAEADAVVTRMGWAYLLVFGIAVAITFVITRWMLTSVVQPIVHMTRLMHQVALGDFGVRVPVRSQDEIGFIAGGFNRMVSDLRDRQQMRDLVGRYVSPAVLEEITQGRLDLGLGGTTRTVAVMFTDLRDFSAMAETMSPAEVMQTMTEYFELMTSAVLDSGGTVLEFLGDGILAVFGAPLPLEDPAGRAVAAALAIRRNRQRLHERAAGGRGALSLGIGIHYGEVIVGNIGTERRLQYGVVGDTVNVAARIESMTREFDCDILISEEVRSQLTSPQTKPLGEVPVKGRRGTVALHQVL